MCLGGDKTVNKGLGPAVRHLNWKLATMEPSCYAESWGSPAWGESQGRDEVAGVEGRGMLQIAAIYQLVGIYFSISALGISLELCPAHSRCSVSTQWMNNAMTKYGRRKEVNSLEVTSEGNREWSYRTWSVKWYLRHYQNAVILTESTLIFKDVKSKQRSESKGAKLDK